jgi:hypothetical protein
LIGINVRMVCLNEIWYYLKIILNNLVGTDYFYQNHQWRKMMRYDIPDIKVTKNMKIIFSCLAVLGLAFSIYVFTHVAVMSGVVTERQVVINKDTNEAKVIFKVNNKQFIYQDKISDLVENESSIDYKLANVNFNIGDTIKLNYKDAYEDQKPTYNSEKMQFNVTSKAKVSFNIIEEQAMDLVEQFIYLNLAKDSAQLKNIIHPDMNGDVSYPKLPANLDYNDVELNFINPKYKLIDDTFELSVRENIDIKVNHNDTSSEMKRQKNKSVYTFKFDGDVLKIYSVETKSV